MKEILKQYYNLDEVFESEKFKVTNIGELQKISRLSKRLWRFFKLDYSWNR